MKPQIQRDFCSLLMVPSYGDLDKGDGQKNTQNRQELHMYDWIQYNLWILKSISNHLKTMGFSFYNVFSIKILVHKKVYFYCLMFVRS